VQAERERWEREALAKARARAAERQERFETPAQIPLHRIYTPEDVSGDYRDKLGFPGEYPFTRGVQPTMYRGRLWTMRQYAGFGTAAEANRRFKYLLEQGQTGLSVTLDLPTQCGFDPLDPMARPEVGKVGVSLSNLAEGEMLFDGIDLGAISTSFTINGTAAIIYAMYVACADRRGVPRAKLTGTTPSGGKIIQTMKVTMAMAITIGTNTPEILSARR
jgi:methylmalonyl-CoA mutase N-terminal domain/subunit